MADEEKVIIAETEEEQEDVESHVLLPPRAKEAESGDKPDVEGHVLLPPAPDA